MRNGFVYFIAYNDEELRKHHPVIKIGMTYDLDKRLKNLSTASAIPLMLAGFIPCDHPETIESRLHLKFCKRRLNGEWFLVDETMLEELRELKITSSSIDQLFQIDDESREIDILRLKLKRFERIFAKRDSQIDELMCVIKKLDPGGYKHISMRIFGYIRENIK